MAVCWFAGGRVSTKSSNSALHQHSGKFRMAICFSAHHFHSFRITSLDFMMENTYKFHTPLHIAPLFSMFFFPLSIQYVFLFMFFVRISNPPKKKNSQNTDTQNSRTCTWLCRPRSNCPSHKAANGYIRRSGAEEIGSTPRKGKKKTGEQRSKPWHDIPLFHFYWLVHRDPYIGFLNFLYNWHHPLIYSKSTTMANWSLFMMRRSCKNSGSRKTCWIYTVELWIPNLPAHVFELGQCFVRIHVWNNLYNKVVKSLLYTLQVKPTSKTIVTWTCWWNKSLQNNGVFSVQDHCDV